MRSSVPTWVSNRFADNVAGNAPCYGCEDRKVGCAGSCERYAAWKEARKAAVQKFYEEENGNRLAVTYKFESRQAQMKRMQRKGRMR